MIKPGLRSDADFPSSLFTIIEHVRGAFTELVSAINADPETPYALSRRLGINKNLTWKICRIIATHEPFSVVEHLPGPQGIEILLRAFADQGAPASTLDEVRAVLAEFERIVELHAGDRRALDLILAAQQSAPLEPAEESRRLAFEGNSAVWGLQARVRFASQFIAPTGADDRTVDAACVAGLVDVRRLRPEVSVPLFRMRINNDDGTARAQRSDALDNSAGLPNPAMLVPAFCSPGAPPLRAVRHGGVLHFELPPGPVGQTAVASWVYGWRISPLGSVYRDERNKLGELATSNFVPAEVLLCDMQIHRSLPFAHDVQRLLYSELVGPYSGAALPHHELPLHEPLLTLGGSPPVVATPLLPRYSEWVHWTFEQLGWQARDFVAVRFVMKYPPIPTTLVMRFPLAERPGAGEIADGVRARGHQ